MRQVALDQSCGIVAARQSLATFIPLKNCRMRAVGFRLLTRPYVSQSARCCRRNPELSRLIEIWSLPDLTDKLDIDQRIPWPTDLTPPNECHRVAIGSLDYRGAI